MPTTARDLADRIPADLVARYLPVLEHGGPSSVRGAIRHERAGLRLDRIAGDVAPTEARRMRNGLRDLERLIMRPDAPEALTDRAARESIR